MIEATITSLLKKLLKGPIEYNDTIFGIGDDKREVRILIEMTDKLKA